MEIYEKTVEVLGPQVQLLMNFMYFQARTMEATRVDCHLVWKAIALFAINYFFYFSESCHRTILWGSQATVS